MEMHFAEEQGYFYPRPPYGGRPVRTGGCHGGTAISIHVPRMGDDRGNLVFVPVDHISIHVPRMGDDFCHHCEGRDDLIFLSTSPVWGTTVVGDDGFRQFRISIHVPRMGDDAGKCGRQNRR